MALFIVGSLLISSLSFSPSASASASLAKAKQTPNQTAKAATAGGAEMCSYYASALTFTPNLDTAVDVVPMSEGYREQFHKRAKSISIPPDAGTLDATCNGTQLTLNLKDEPTITIEFAKVVDNVLTINQTPFRLSRTRDLADLISAVERALHPRQKSANALLETVLIPRAEALDPAAVWRGTVDTLKQTKEPSGTLGWKASSSSAGLTVSLVTVSAGQFVYQCRAPSTSFGSTITNFFNNRMCGIGTAGQMFRYMSGFKNFQFVCKGGLVQTINYSLSGYREDQSPVSGSIKFSYTNRKLARVEKNITGLSSHSDAAALHNESDEKNRQSCIYRFIDDIIADVTGGPTCLSETPAAEFNGSVGAITANCVTFIDEDYGRGTFREFNTPFFKKEIPSRPCSTKVGMTDNERSQLMHLLGERPQLADAFKADPISPIANIPLVQRCCSEADCVEATKHLAELNGRGDRKPTAPAKKASSVR